MKFVPRRLDKTADISRGTRGAGEFLKNALLIACFLLLAYWLLGLGALWMAKSIPDAWEKKLGGPNVAMMAPEPEQEEALAGAQALLDRLMEGESLRELDYRLFIFNFPEPNAIAAPGGGIGVTPALLESMQSESGLAFVLAHELGHHQKRHLLQRMGRGLVFALVSTVLFNAEGLSLLKGGISLAEMGHSREHEREADDFALRLLHRKNMSLEEALELFHLIKEKDHFLQKYIGTHPLTEERIKHVETLIRELKAKGEPAPAP